MKEALRSNLFLYRHNTGLFFSKMYPSDLLFSQTWAFAVLRSPLTEAVTSRQSPIHLWQAVAKLAWISALHNVPIISAASEDLHGSKQAFVTLVFSLSAPFHASYPRFGVLHHKQFFQLQLYAFIEANSNKNFLFFTLQCHHFDITTLDLICFVIFSVFS